MKFSSLPIKGAYLIEPEPCFDDRGFFARLFCRNEFRKIKHYKPLIQINQSHNVKKGTIRGIHFQVPPGSDIKLVKCIKGKVFDVIVDLRKNSDTFLQWHGEYLSAQNMRMMYIPEGVAHGFQTIVNNTQLIYFHTAEYCSKYDRGVNLYDPMMNIKWPIKITVISQKDKALDFISPKFKGVNL